MLGKMVVCRTISQHLHALSYAVIQVQHSDFVDFNNGGCYVMKTTIMWISIMEFGK